MPIQAEQFRHALGRFASGVTVVTAIAADGERHGLTVSAFSSLSLHPPYILICIDKRSGAIPVIESTRRFGVNVLASEQQDLSNQFASRVADKFAGVALVQSVTGVPLLEGALVRLECELAQEIDGGDHMIFVGLVEHAEVDESKGPLLYYAGQYGQFS